ncbi:MAG: glycosyltransferase family 9 protein [Pseudomonadota bacterium]
MNIPAKKILLVTTRRLGDVLLVTPLLRSLRIAYPDAQIDMLVYQNTAVILKGNSDFDHLISVTEHPNFKEYKKLFKQIFRRYDLSISTLAGDRPLIYAILAAAKRIAIVPPKRWQDAWKRWFVQAWTELDDKYTHTVVQYLRLADLLDIKRYYEIVVPQLPDSKAKLDKLLPFSWQKKNFAVLHLAPMYNYKRWTLNGWQELSQYLTDTGMQVVLTGGSGEGENRYIQDALSKMPESVVNLAGKLSFSDVSELIKNSQIYIGPDTAVTHLAAATGVPTIALFGPTNPLKWAPWPYQYAFDETPFNFIGTKKVANVVLLQGKLQEKGDCVPCHQEGCEQHRESSSRCLEELDSSIVIDWVKTMTDCSKD